MRYLFFVAILLIPFSLCSQDKLNFRVVYYVQNDILIDSLPEKKNIALQFYDCESIGEPGQEKSFSCMRVKWKKPDAWSIGAMQNIETDISDSFTPEGVIEKFVFDWYYSNTHNNESGKAKVWVTLWQKEEALLIEMYAEFGLETVEMLGYLE